MTYTYYDDLNNYKLNSIHDIYKIHNPENVKILNLSYSNVYCLSLNILYKLINLNTLIINNTEIFYIDKDNFKYNTQLEIIYLNDNKLKSINKDCFINLTQLKELNLSRNSIKNLDVDTFKYNTQLEELYLDSNEINNIDSNTFNNLLQLKVLSLSFNKLTNLDNDIFKYNIHLNKLSLSHNNIDSFNNDIIKYNTQLKYLNFNNNKIVYLNKDIFNNLTRLQILHLTNNRLTYLDNDIFKYNIRLNELGLAYNNLRTIPTSILLCRKLYFIDYCFNEIEYIPPHIQNFLNRLRQQSHKLQVYNDSQNVHNHQIQECIKTSLENILNIPKIINKELLIDNLVKSEIIGDTSIQLLLEYCQDKSIHSILNINFEEALLHVLEYINIECSEHKEEIYKILGEEILDGRCKCFTGRISRLINCLNGFTPLVEVKIPENMELSNIIIMIKNNYNGDSVDELKEIARKELLERGYENELINEYVEYIEI